MLWNDVYKTRCKLIFCFQSTLGSSTNKNPPRSWLHTTNKMEREFLRYEWKTTVYIKNESAFCFTWFFQEENVKKRRVGKDFVLNCRVEKTCVTVEDAVPTATGFLVNLSNGLLDSHRRPHRFITPAHFSLFFLSFSFLLLLSPSHSTLFILPPPGAEKVFWHILTQFLVIVDVPSGNDNKRILLKSCAIISFSNWNR